MYTDRTLQPISDHQQYIGANGTQYPPNYPKTEIPGLFSVTETPRPTDSSLVVTGFTINSQRVQVWQTREKTADELSGELRGQALSALEVAKDTAIRCLMEGVPVPAEWKTYAVSLRTTVNGKAGPLPIQPEYPEVTR